MYTCGSCNGFFLLTCRCFCITFYRIFTSCVHIVYIYTCMHLRRLTAFFSLFCGKFLGRTRPCFSGRHVHVPAAASVNRQFCIMFAAFFTDPCQIKCIYVYIRFAAFLLTFLHLFYTFPWIFSVSHIPAFKGVLKNAGFLILSKGLPSSSARRPRALARGRPLPGAYSVHAQVLRARALHHHPFFFLRSGRSSW